MFVFVSFMESVGFILNYLKFHDDISSSRELSRTSKKLYKLFRTVSEHYDFNFYNARAARLT